MEKIKINEKLYDLLVNGVQLTDQGGRVIFQPAAATFAEVEADVKATKAITVLDDAGNMVTGYVIIGGMAYMLNPSKADMATYGALMVTNNLAQGNLEVQRVE